VSYHDSSGKHDSDKSLQRKMSHAATHASTLHAGRAQRFKKRLRIQARKKAKTMQRRSSRELTTPRDERSSSRWQGEQRQNKKRPNNASRLALVGWHPKLRPVGLKPHRASTQEARARASNKTQAHPRKRRTRRALAAITKREWPLHPDGRTR
jgi:hypothetical protein